MEIFLSVIAIILVLIGFTGAILPIIPGPIISYLALLSLFFLNPSPFTNHFMITWGILTIVITAFDQIIPALGTKKMGGSKFGVNGSIIGLILGIFLFPPLGIIIGPFVGALIGELIGGKDFNNATKAGIGSFLGFLAGTILKLIFSFVVFYYVIINTAWHL